MTKIKLVKCPVCGYEYFPAEIFYPKELLGTPKDIIRDDLGHIIFCNGEEPDLTEIYECDNCHTSFSTTVTFLFESRVDTIGDFSSDYESPIYKERLFLDEDEVSTSSIFDSGKNDTKNKE